jgi:bifunctional UDP-N-acetylglucosamine pyrophosphorylase/glucosamine-1-phosphate N-acetyltransferase
MQAVILAAGKGTRMGILSNSTPKPMLKVLGKSLLEHKIDMLPDAVDEIIFVINHLGDQIQNHFGENYNGRKISYVEQPELNGTAGALFQAKEILKDRFIVMMGDDLYGREDMKKAIGHKNAVLVRKTEGSTPGGKVVLDEDEHLLEIVEDKKGDIHNGLVNTGFYVLSSDIFNYEPVRLGESKEFGLPQTMVIMAKDLPVKVVLADFWLNITSPEDLLLAEKVLSPKLK